jgi:hypothetical protein
MRWAGHAARVEGLKIYTKILVGNLNERDYLEDLGKDGKIILKFVWFRTVTSGVFL